MGAGKGDKARNCHTKKFRDNYDQINWGRDKRTFSGAVTLEELSKRKSALDELSARVQKAGLYK